MLADLIQFHPGDSLEEILSFSAPREQVSSQDSWGEDSAEGQYLLKVVGWSVGGFGARKGCQVGSLLGPE